jgi:hypothetical protein
MTRSTRIVFSAALASLVVAGGVVGCTMDVVPVSSSRVKSAKLAEQPLLRGPDAPGAFKHVWDFTQPKDKLFDPSDLEFSQAGVGLKKRTEKAPQTTHSARVGIFVTKTGPWFTALDTFKEELGAAKEGFVRYQLSPDSSTWYYHDGKNWTPAGPNHQQANSSGDIQLHFGNFHTKVGEGTLVLKVFLVAPQGSEGMHLKTVEIQGVSLSQDGWD